MGLERIRVVRGANAKEMGDMAKVPFRTISPQLRSLCQQWDSEYCFHILQTRFGSPSYKLSCDNGSEAWVWVLWSKRPENIIYIEAWPRNLPNGFYLHCQHWNSAVVEFSLWLTRSHLQRHLQPVQGGKL